MIPTVVPSNDDGGRAMDRLLRRFSLVTNQDAAKANFIAKMKMTTGGGNIGRKITKKEKVDDDSFVPGDCDVDRAEGVLQEDLQEESMEELMVQGEEAVEEEESDPALGLEEKDAQEAQQHQEESNEDDVIELLDDDEEEDDAIMESTKNGGKKEKSNIFSKESEDWEMLVGLTNGDLAPQQAQQLLKAVHGNISRAADIYFTGKWKEALAASSKTTQNTSFNNNNNQRPKKRTTTGIYSGGGGGAAVAPNSGTKRRRSDAGAATTLMPGQKSILSFFGGPAVAQTKVDPSLSPSPAAIPTAAADDDIAAALSRGAPSSVKAEDLGKLVTNSSAQEIPSPAKKKPALTTMMQKLPRPATATATAASTRTTTVPRDAVTLPLHQYNPILHAPWSGNVPTPYIHLARAFESMDSTTKRLAISDMLTNMFRSILALSPQDLPSSAYLAVGKIAPDYEQGKELSVGGSTVAAAISEATGVTRSRLRELYNVMGDLGDVAATCKRTQSTLARPAPLTIAGVHATLRSIAAEQGSGAARRRQAAVLRMLRACREAETKYLVRTLVQALRVGANWRSVVPALAKAILIHSVQADAIKAYLEEESAPSSSTAPPRPPSMTLPSIPPKFELDAAAAAASAAFHVCPNLDLLIAAMLEGPMSTLQERCRLTFGVPIKPMLAKISEGVEDAISQLKGAPFVAEYKYDGVRAQIHLRKGAQNSITSISGGVPDQDVMIFSRNSEDRTASFPDVAAQVIEAASGGAISCILDAEVVAVDRGCGGNGSTKLLGSTKVDNDGGTTAIGGTSEMSHPGKVSSTASSVLRLRPFQDLASRPRGVVDRSLLTVDICVFVFDILELNGVSLLGLPLRERREALIRALPGLRPGYVQRAQGFEVERKKEDSQVVLQIAEVTAAGTAGVETLLSAEKKVDDEDVTLSVEEGSKKSSPLLIEDKEEEVLSLEDVEMEVSEIEEVMPVKPSKRKGENATAGTAGVLDSDLLDRGLVDKIHGWLLDSLAAGTEGLMLKSLDAAYQPSRRSEHWIKLKKDYCDALHDTLDLVVIGAWHGSGRKAGWYSPFLLAVYDPETEELQSLCRCMSGFTDEFYKASTARLKETIIPTKRPYYVTQESPDVWFDAKEVWEVRGAEISLSPVHKAAIGKIPGSERGAGLRFPRFLRIREDKAIEEATSADAIAAMYQAQERKIDNKGGGGKGER